MRRIDDYKAILRLAAPILAGQLGTIATGFADNIMVGQYSTAALASASFVNGVFNTTMFCCMGFTYGILPLVGALCDGNDGAKGRIGSLMRNALCLNTIYAIALTAIMTCVYVLVPHMGQPEELLPLIRPYYLLSLAGIIPVMVINVMSQWSYGIKNTVMPMWIILGANVLNIGLNYLLIYGRFGLPEWGLTGAGVATLISRVTGAAVIAGVFFLGKNYAEYRRGFASTRVSRHSLGLVWRTSIPVSMQMTFESGSFSFAAIVAGWLGKIELASFQIIVIVGMLGFSLYYAVGSAIAVMVAGEAAKGSREGMRRVAWSGYHVMLALATCSSVVFALGARALVGLFTTDTAVLTVTLTLIVPLVLYQLGDATQIAFANALRGTSRVMPMLWVAFVSYVVVGIPATYLMAIPWGGGIYGVLLSFSVSLFLAASLFLVYFLRATRIHTIDSAK